MLESGERCNVEVQKRNDDDHERRVRYNASCITANITDPGLKFEKVPNIISIFVTKFDIFKKKKTVYHVDRVVRETGEVLYNGYREIYVNTKIDDGSDIAKLMTIYKNREVYDYQKFPRTSKRKEQFIKSKKGEMNMCELVENYAKEVAEKAAKEAAKEAARNLLSNGVDFRIVCASMNSITEDELRVIYEEVKMQN